MDISAGGMKFTSPASFDVEVTKKSDGSTISYHWFMSSDEGNHWVSIDNETSSEYLIDETSLEMNGYLFRCDVTENISVTSNTVNYPSNTVVMSEVVDKEDSEYSKILEKAKVKNAHIVDINLYSSSVGDIDDFDGAEFNVSVPIEDEKQKANPT